MDISVNIIKEYLNENLQVNTLNTIIINFFLNYLAI